MSLRLCGMLGGMLPAEGLAFPQPAPVRKVFRDLYSSLPQRIGAFDRAVGSRSAREKCSVAWSAELLTADRNRGRALLEPGNTEDYQRLLTVCQELLDDIYAPGLKIIVESAILFLGSYRRGSGFKLAEYYATLEPRHSMDGGADTEARIGTQAGFQLAPAGAAK